MYHANRLQVSFEKINIRVNSLIVSLEKFFQNKINNFYLSFLKF